MIYILGFIATILLLFILLFLFCSLVISSRCSNNKRKNDSDE